MQEYGLEARYLADNNLHIWMIVALAFVSPNHVIQSFDDLAQLISNAFLQDADDILDYNEENYNGRFRHNALRKESFFPIEIWIEFNQTDEELLRTNNVVEGWHRGFLANVEACHPQFWKFLGILKTEESSNSCSHSTESRRSSTTTPQEGIYRPQCLYIVNLR